MAVDGVSSNSSSSASDVTRVVKKELDKDAFLQLLATQLSYQDPMNPTSNQDSIAQLAQFSALEQMTNVNTNLSDLRAINLNMQSSSYIGRTIEGKDENGNAVNGVVTSIVPTDTFPMAIVGDSKVFLPNITKIS